MFVLLKHWHPYKTNPSCSVNAISLKHIVGTYMGGNTPVCNTENILGVPIGLSFHKIPPWLGLWKVDVCKLVSDGTNFVPPFRNIDQLLQIDVKYVFDSYCILIWILFLFDSYFYFDELFGFNYIFIRKTYVVTNSKDSSSLFHFKMFQPCLWKKWKEDVFMNKYKIM